MSESLELTDVQLKMIQDGKFSWYKLDAHQRQDFLVAHPEYKKQLETVEAEVEEWSSDDWIWFNTSNETISQDRDNKNLNQIDILRDPDSEFTIKDLRWSISDYGRDAWAQRELMKKDDRYKKVDGDIQRSLRNMKDRGELTTFRIAYQEWWDYVMNDENVSDRLTDAEKYNLRQKRIDDFRQKYGEPVYQAIHDVIDEGLKDVDPLLYKLTKDKLALSDSYWRLVDEYGDPDQEARREFRKDKDNAEFEAILVFWGYVSKFENPEAEPIVRQWMQDFNIPEKAIPAFAEYILPDKAELAYKVTQTEWSEYQKMGDKYERDDQVAYYRWQYLLKHPNLNAYLVKEESKADARTVFHNVPESDAWLKTYNEKYLTLLTIKGKPDTTRRREFRTQNPEFDELGAKYGYWKKLPETKLQSLGKP